MGKLITTEQFLELLQNEYDVPVYAKRQSPYEHGEISTACEYSNGGVSVKREEDTRVYNCYSFVEMHRVNLWDVQSISGLSEHEIVMAVDEVINRNKKDVLNTAQLMHLIANHHDRAVYVKRRLIGRENWSPTYAIEHDGGGVIIESDMDSDKMYSEYSFSSTYSKYEWEVIDIDFCNTQEFESAIKECISKGE